MSALLLNLGSEYASTILMVSPVRPTVPAMPCPTGTLMFFAPSAIDRTSSWVSWSRIKIVDLSQSKIRQVSVIMFSVACRGSKVAIVFEASRSFVCPSIRRLSSMICSARVCVAGWTALPWIMPFSSTREVASV